MLLLMKRNVDPGPLQGSMAIQAIHTMQIHLLLEDIKYEEKPSVLKLTSESEYFLSCNFFCTIYFLQKLYYYMSQQAKGECEIFRHISQLMVLHS